jgi:hypothetical protein
MTRQLSLAIVGADYLNKKGPTRRFEIAMCKPGEAVELRREPNNPADPRAIAVYSQRDILLGYVRAERAQLVGKFMSSGAIAAIFQQAEPWGATIRIGIDGTIPTLPDQADPRSHDWPPPLSEDAEWWPDEQWPDDPS